MKKIASLTLLLVSIFILSACTDTGVVCGPGTIADGDICVVDTGDTDEVTISVNGYQTLFEVGDSVPDFKTYFTVTNATITDEMISQSIVKDASNNFSQAGTYQVSITIGNISKFVTITVTGDDNNNNNNSGTISVNADVVTQFEIGDTLPDFSTYFTVENGSVNPADIQHNILLDATNVMTTAGVYSVTLVTGGYSKTIAITVMDPNFNFEDFIEEGVAGIYVDPSKQTTFEMGDVMPNFLTYFIAYDGANYINITPDLVLHNMVLSADTRMIQPGTYAVWVDLTINGIPHHTEIELIVNTIGGNSVESIGDTGWEIVNPNFTEVDLFAAWFIPTGDVSVSNDNNEVEVAINSIGMNYWDILFGQPGKTFEKGYTYTVTYRMKTNLEAGRDVMVFVESAPGAPKTLEEQVSLTTSYQEFTFTFTVDNSTTTGMIGTFIGANLPGAHPGSVFFDSVVLTRTGELIPDVNLIDLPNQDFANTDISNWGTEGQVALSHDVAGYLVADVAGFTGAFYQENIQNGGYKVEAGKTYSVSYTIKTDIVAGRDVTFFVEDTDAGYAKYFENTETLTTEFQTFTYTFTASADNTDTKVGIFLGDMDNALLGSVIIDSIIITETN